MFGRCDRVPASEAGRVTERFDSGTLSPMRTYSGSAHTRRSGGTLELRTGLFCRGLDRREPGGRNLARLFLDEDHQGLGQNPIVLHGLGSSS